ncbi:prostaglandin E receptor 1c (subtype EP1) [Melanotaenia boesemani]|uniref:prostaglandin E receptor 1c (subtype EP1) n=1 Tax=Melanotaenia boesemani TaxID=1250792 RepID=UPI001C03B083|nr:prostaglandin E receptor 1c (subtype EP1) [Melanotaenia boesemani]
MSCFTMILGTVSNLTALGILFNSRARFRRQSKAPFLQLTVSLLLADLGGHLILGAFALYLHMYNINKTTEGFCYIFGASMVFFGLCPLLLGCAMAVERCVAITQPFFHVSTITAAHVKGVVLILFSLALLLAYLPFLNVGTYTIQYPNTWCFLPIHNPESAADTNVVLAFSCLGLTALILSLLCNILSGLTLLHARIRSSKGYTKPTAGSARRASSVSSSSLFFSLDVEMMMQLAAITVVSCVCWAPFLIHSLVIQFNASSGDSDDLQGKFTLLTLRMASWNQILDPWVYILLRRTVLLRVCCGFSTLRPTVIADSSSAETRRQVLSVQ